MHSELMNCAQQTLKLPGFSLHHMTHDGRCAAGGLLRQQVSTVCS